MVEVAYPTDFITITVLEDDIHPWRNDVERAAPLGRIGIDAASATFRAGHFCRNLRASIKLGRMFQGSGHAERTYGYPSAILERMNDVGGRRHGARRRTGGPVWDTRRMNDISGGCASTMDRAMHGLLNVWPRRITCEHGRLRLSEAYWLSIANIAKTPVCRR